MKYTVTGYNNFCRVFELPQKFPTDYCFGGGIPVNFQMVDWFNPVPNLPQWGIPESKYKELVESGEITNTETHTAVIESDELQKSITDFLIQKVYVKQDRKYIVITNFGMSFMFQKQKQ